MFSEIAAAVRLLFSARRGSFVCALVRGRFSFGRRIAPSLLDFYCIRFCCCEDKKKKISLSIDHEAPAEVKQGVSISSQGRSHCCSLTFCDEVHDVGPSVRPSVRPTPSVSWLRLPRTSLFTSSCHFPLVVIFISKFLLIHSLTEKPVRPFLML